MTNHEDRQVRREIIRRINRVVCAGDFTRGADLEVANEQPPLAAIGAAETKATLYACPYGFVLGQNLLQCRSSHAILASKLEASSDSRGSSPCLGAKTDLPSVPRPPVL